MVKRSFNLIPGFIRLLGPMLIKEMGNETEHVYKHMIKNWERGMDSMNRPWEPLDPSTIAAKGHSDPLIDSREMIDSAGYEVDKSNMTASIYIEDPKIPYHEFGTESIPRRPILTPAGEYFMEDVDSSVGKAVDNAVGNAGSGGLGMTVGKI